MERRTIVITGATNNYGRAIALRYARDGHNLILADVTETEQIRTVAAECREAGSDYVLSFSGDLSDPDNVRRLYGQVAVTFGGADILIDHTACCCRAAIPYMKKTRQGAMVLLSDPSADRRELTASLTEKLASFNARINNLIIREEDDPDSVADAVYALCVTLPDLTGRNLTAADILA